MKRNLLLLFGHILFWLLLDGVFQLSTNRAFTFVDDHTIISTYDLIAKHGIANYIIEVIENTLRFRPVMDFNRAFYVTLFGTNITYISYYFLLLAGISSFLYQQFIRSAGYNFRNSLLIVTLTLVGMQSVIWWKFDESENLGTFFMALAMYSGYQGLLNNNKKWLNIPVFLISVVCMSLSKESFIIILPFLAILFRKNLPVAILLIVLCFAELLYIKLFIGTTFGYAGVDTATYSLRNIAKVTAQYMVRGYGIPIILLIGYLSHQHRKNLKAFWFENRFYVAIIIIGIFPFLLLYAKSGINVGRYLLPLLIPQIYVIFHLLGLLSNVKARLSVVAIILLLFGYHVGKFIQLQQDFVTENKVVHNFRSEIESRTDSEDDILVLANPVEDFEKAGALMIYLKSKNALNRKNSKLQIIDLDEYEETHPAYTEFKQRNKQAINTHSTTNYKKWLVINNKVLNKIKSDSLLNTSHKLTTEENYSIIVFD